MDYVRVGKMKIGGGVMRGWEKVRVSTDPCSNIPAVVDNSTESSLSIRENIRNLG